MNKTIIYTALFGDSSKLLPQPHIKGADFICFSDKIHHSKSWKVIKAAPPFGQDHTRNNRYYKILPHLFLHDYEYSVYIDASFMLLKSPLSLIETEMSDCNMLVFNHDQTIKDARNCIYK